jgi:hypothetical protein
MIYQPIILINQPLCLPDDYYPINIDNLIDTHLKNLPGGYEWKKVN